MVEFIVSAARDALARAVDTLFEDESMTLKMGHSVLAIGFEEADIADWTEHEPLRVHSIVCGTLADAVVAGSTVDALLLDQERHPEHRQLNHDHAYPDFLVDQARQIEPIVSSTQVAGDEAHRVADD